MRTLKKVLALILTAMLMMALGMTAYAAEGDYSITIDNSSNTTVSIVGKTFTAYKLFDVTYAGSDADDAHSYSIDSDGDGAWAWDTIKGTLKAGSTTVYENADYGLTFTPTSADPSVYAVTSAMTAAQARSLADALQQYLSNDPDGLVIAATETAVIDLNEAGYYVVYGTVKANDSADGSEELVAALALTTADPTETVIPKVEAPTLDKKITGEHVLDAAGKAATAEIGKTVTFELDSNVPDVTGYSAYTFMITDTMSAGLTFTVPHDVLVKINGNDKTEECTISVSGQTMTVTIPLSTLQAAGKDAPIVVTYSAVLNNNALTTDYEKNTAILTYSNNPYEDTTNDTPEKTVYVIDVDINVDKVANSAGGSKLDGAKFKVFKGNAEPEASSPSWYKWDSTNNKVLWVTKAEADEFVTGIDGKFTPNVRGLEAESTGTAYGLLETEPPAGYNLLDDPIIVTLTGAYNGTSEQATVTASQNATVTNGTINLSEAQNANQPLATTQIINKSGSELPSTGGIGTTLFYVIGGVLLVGAGALLVAKKRTDRNF